MSHRRTRRRVAGVLAVAAVTAIVASTLAAGQPQTPGPEIAQTAATRLAALATATPVPASSAAAASQPAVEPTGAPSPVRTASAGRIVANVAFTEPVNCGRTRCQVKLDVYVPSGIGPFPEVVLIRGGPTGIGGRAYMRFFAREVAAAGFVVFNADMRDEASAGGGYPAAFQDVACAVRFARAEAAEFDGDSEDVTLVGHSLGGFVGSVVALDDQELGSNCLAPGSGRPDAFVGLAGNYRLASPEVAGDLAVFFGGAPASTSAARSASDPFNYAAGTHIPVRLVAGTADAVVNPAASTALETFLQGRGWDVWLRMVPGAGHGSLVDASSAGPISLAAISEARAAEQAGGPRRWTRSAAGGS